MQGMVAGKAAHSGGFAWKPEEGTQIHLINRHTGSTRTVQCSTNFFAFHFMNAFETADGKSVVVDCPAFGHGGVTDAFLLDRLRSGSEDVAPSPLRYGAAVCLLALNSMLVHMIL